jgi:ADP-heptose:LPS heptosyltransferase
MTEAYDIKSLVEKFKAHGLDIAEEAAKAATISILDWFEESAKLSATPFDDVALVVLPAFHLVRKAFPNAHITLLTNIPVHAKAAPMEAVLGGAGFYDDVLRYPVSMRTFDGLVRLRKSLKEGAYDCLVYMASPKGGLMTSLRDFLFFRSCGIPQVIGVPFSRSTLRSLPVPGTNLYTSRTSRALEALSVLGKIDTGDPLAWDLGLTREETAEAESLLGRHGITSKFLAVSAGTKMPAKDWEEHNWVALMRRLAEEYPGLPLVLLGVSEERERSERLMEIWSGPKANLCGLTSPRVSAAVLRNAVVMVCHDSGPMHLAATMGVPCVAIFSARAKPGEWFPGGDNHTSPGCRSIARFTRRYRGLKKPAQYGPRMCAATSRV